MQRKFLANLMLLLFLNILIKPMYIFGIDLRVQNLVGADEYGLFFSIFNFSMLFNIILDFGITNYNNRNISQHKHLLNKHFSGIVTLRLMLAVVYAVVTLGIGWIAGYSTRQMGLLGILILNQFIIAFILYLRSNIAGLQMFRTDSIISILDRLILIVLCGILLYNSRYSHRFTIEHFAWLQTLGYFITMLICLWVVMRKAAFTKFYWNRAFSLMIIRQSFPFALLTLLMMFYFRIDSVLLERILPASEGARQAGIYASAFRLLDAVLMVPYLFSVLLLPMFSRMLRFREDISQIIRLAFPILLVFSITTAALSVGYSLEIMSLLYHDHAAESAQVFRLLMPGLIAFSVSYVFSTLLTANGSLWMLNKIALVGMVMNIGLNFLLIPTYLAAGSAIASCTTLFVAATAQLLISMKLFRLKIPGRLLMKFLLFLLSIPVLLYLEHHLPFGWLTRMIIVGSTMMLVTVASGLIRPRELLKILQNHP